MKRYTFLLLAFFLSLNSHAEGLGLNINVAPSGFSNHEILAIREGLAKPPVVNRNLASRHSNAVTDIRNNSTRNIKEVGSINEPTERAQVPSPVIPLDTGVPELATENGKTAISNVSCKTYEGKIYDQGEAGYNDCIRTIKTDRQKDTTIP